MSNNTPDTAPRAPAAPENAASVQVENAPPSRRMNPKRKRALMAVASIVVLAGLGWAAYDWLVLSHYEETDNAYVQGNVIQITPQVGGTVTAIYADETDPVKVGQPLVKLDPADAVVALAQVGVGGGGRIVAPRVAAGSARGRVPPCGGLPFELGRQAGAAPAAERVGLVAAHVLHRLVGQGVEVEPPTEPLDAPGAGAGALPGLGLPRRRCRCG